MGSGDFDENRVGVGHPTWVDPPVDVSLVESVKVSMCFQIISTVFNGF